MVKDILEPAMLARIYDLGKILASAALLYVVLRMVVVRVISALARRTRTDWDETFVRRGTFNRLAALAPGVLVYVLAGLWFEESTLLWSVLRGAASLWILFFGLLTLYAILDSLNDIYSSLPFARQLPIRSFVQVVKLIAFLAFVIIAIAGVMGQSPAILVSGLGAMTAVLMLVFKDPILGFVAGINLSANRMLAVGDWLEMPKYNADGDVIDITLTTVKVRNWDQTITTVPTYALISDAFKNWRGMQEAGGRRICRSVLVDMNTIRFLDTDDIDRLRKTQLLSRYLDEKIAAVDEYNREHHIDPGSPINGRRLTNVGTFRAYLTSYLTSHPGIHQGMICMVRQLQPTEHGLPLQLYAFTRDTAWVAHENVQSDIFDHVFAAAGAFDLSVYQYPSGADIRTLTGLKRTPERG